MPKVLGKKLGRCVGQACTSHISYYIANKEQKKEKEKVKSAEICRGCEHMEQGYCNYYSKWCSSVNRSVCKA